MRVLIMQSRWYLRYLTIMLFGTMVLSGCDQ